MLFRQVFFSRGAGMYRFRPLRSTLFTLVVCIVFLLAWEAVGAPASFSDGAWLLLVLVPITLLYQIAMVALGLQGVIGAPRAMGRKGFALPSIFEDRPGNRSALPVVLSLIASLYCASAALLLPFTAITFNGDGCAEWTAALYRFLLLVVNLVPGYDACIEMPPLLYRTARFIINVMIAGALIARLPDLIRSKPSREAP
ncbi:MAG: hypothetical protein WA980_10930 [Shinella zoogloeoides]|uniref:hypothetical protein n=1 Tax=Shinella zoogloeoides TaxID=352475 RepID=UPI003C73B4EF